MNQFTPGPWIRKGEQIWNEDEVMYIAADNFNTISPSETLEANARLISCAPRLLDVLRYIVERLPDDEPKAVMLARSAIRVATGESK